MKRFSLRLKDELHEKLRVESFQTGVSINKIIVEAVEQRYNKEEMDEMLRITELREGVEIGLNFEGTLEKVVEWLKENYDKLFDWIEGPDVELPDLENIETVRELKAELDKVDHDWWSIEVEKI